MMSAASARRTPRGPAEAAAEAAWQKILFLDVEVRAAPLNGAVFNGVVPENKRRGRGRGERTAVEGSVADAEFVGVSKWYIIGDGE